MKSLSLLTSYMICYTLSTIWQPLGIGMFIFLQLCLYSHKYKLLKNLLFIANKDPMKYTVALITQYSFLIVSWQLGLLTNVNFVIISLIIFITVLSICPIPYMIVVFAALPGMLNIMYLDILTIYKYPNMGFLFTIRFTAIGFLCYHKYKTGDCNLLGSLIVAPLYSSNCFLKRLGRNEAQFGEISHFMLSNLKNPNRVLKTILNHFATKTNITPPLYTKAILIYWISYFLFVFQCFFITHHPNFPQFYCYSFLSYAIPHFINIPCCFIASSLNHYDIGDTSFKKLQFEMEQDIKCEKFEDDLIKIFPRDVALIIVDYYRDNYELDEFEELGFLVN